jgi:hypothetical protein
MADQALPAKSFVGFKKTDHGFIAQGQSGIMLPVLESVENETINRNSNRLRTGCIISLLYETRSEPAWRERLGQE